mgnify:CR=1 FL=1
MIGMYAFAYPNMIVEHYTAERGLPNNIVNCTLKGQDGFIWFGTWYGLCSFDGSKFRSYDNHDGFYSTDIPPRKIQRIVEDKNGFLWIKTIDRKLYLFDKRHESFHAVYDDVKEYSENIQIIKIQTTEDGDVLLLTKDKSLLRAYTDKEGKITMKQLHDSRPNVNVYDMRLKHNIFCETAEFINWIGMDYQILSLRKGEALKDKPADFIQKKVSANPDQFTCASYNSKFLWLGDKKGHIYSIDPQNGVVNRYEIPEIKQPISNLLVTESGLMWIGTRQGILTFSPDKLETLHTNYDTRIVDFKVSNRDLRSFRECPILKESITYAKAIELNYNQSMFTIEFAALNFYNQNRVSYRYILEGYEKEWHYNGKNRIASYTNVPPGDYTFRVETVDEANPELVSNCTLAITILPPWWLSWWATLIYVILGLAALYFSLRLAFFMLKMKNDIYIEQKVSEMKIKFFTNISHELRTPLTLIKGPIQELREREKLSPKGLQYVDLMEKNTNQMLQLVNQILDFRKIQNGKMRLHVSLIDFNEMIASFQKEFRVLSEENENSFTFQLPDEPIMVWADKEKMSIVIRNIISNAFKFTHSGGSIYITTGLTDDGKRCYVRVEDNGVGIPQNKLTEIFERFSQGENAKNSYYQGTGIGLALSKEIVNLHHGQIRAESPEGQGAVFIVELLMDKEHYRPSEVDFYVGDTETAPIAVEQDPVANAISEDGTEEEEPEIDASLPTLLLVEDNKDLCQLIKLQLEDKFNIHIANNGVEGLKKVHLYHPDIVVTDQMMPEMDGLEMLQSIRKDFQISHIPVIILTAKNDEGAKTKAITLGANAYITKPFSKEYLLARIDQLLAERKLFRERIRQQMENQTTTEEDSYEQFLVKKDVQFLEKIHQVIEENMDDSDFNIDTIASGIGLSRSAFFKKLKSLTGLAPVDLVKEIRLNKSIELIKNTDLSVSEIAFAVGFKDSGYYSKCFRKKYNQSPREYMNEWRKGER